MEKEIDFLREWTVRYIKNKDLMSRKITSINEEGNTFTVSKSDVQYKFFMIPFLEDGSIEKIKGAEYSKTIVCFHTKSNYEFMINNWKKLVEFGRTFTIYFVNPFSKLDKIIIVCPYTHDLISDDESLKTGLKTMSENVEFTTEEEVKKIINS